MHILDLVVRTVLCGVVSVIVVCTTPKEVKWFIKQYKELYGNQSKKLKHRNPVFIGEEKLRRKAI